MKVLAHTKALLDEMQESFQHCFERMSSAGGLVKPFNISVMTILLTFDTSFCSSHVETFAEQNCKTFQNQVSLKGEDPVTGSRYCVKLFKNGRMHVTGCKSVPRALLVAEEVLGRLYPGVEQTLSGIDIEMLNMDFQVNTPLHLPKLMEAFDADGVVTCYKPMNYPGAKLQLGYCTVLCFSSGSVIVTGARNIRSAMRGFDVFRRVLGESGDATLMPLRVQKRSKRRRTQEIAPDEEVYRPLLESVYGINY
jgi:TATA-box binding protein (TBP) (component of TFIID and TFIIIB)